MTATAGAAGRMRGRTGRTGTGWRHAGARLAGAAALVVALSLPAPPAGAVGLAPAGPDVFGTSSMRSNNLEPFTKWRGALDRHFKERQAGAEPCRGTLFTSCPVQDWHAFLHSLAGLAPEEQMRRVHAFHNRARYILDIVNWLVEDYWATPHEFLRRDGDCEDYAIAKFMSLRLLGFPNDRMRIVVLRDLNLRADHAVLVVELDGTSHVLDNQIRQPVPDTVIHHYRPIYSVNETHWWLHQGT